MTLTLAGHSQGCKHVHVVAGKIQADKRLEHERPPWPCLAQKDQQASCRATIRHHIQHSTKLRRLFEIPSCVTVERIEQAGHGV